MLRLRRRTDFLTSVPAKRSKLIRTAVPVGLLAEKISWQSIVIDLVILMLPVEPIGSRQLTSPLTAVIAIAWESVAQGAARVHGLVSERTPETQVRVCP